jgi:hypothetical protein
MGHAIPALIPWMSLTTDRARIAMGSHRTTAGVHIVIMTLLL